MLRNQTHRQAGNPDGVDIVGIRLFRQLLVEFLKSIDRGTKPFEDVYPPATVCGPVVP